MDEGDRGRGPVHVCGARVQGADVEEHRNSGDRAGFGVLDWVYGPGDDRGDDVGSADIVNGSERLPELAREDAPLRAGVYFKAGFAETLQFVNEGASADTQRLCRFGAIEIMLAQCLKNGLPFDFPQIFE